MAILAASARPAGRGDRLVRAANRAGGIDNITVVVLDVEAEDGEDTEGPPTWREIPSRRRLLRVAGRIAVVLLILAVAVIGLRVYVDRQWYVGVSGGRVAVFRGIPAEFAGLHFSHPVVITEIPAADAETISFYAQLPEGLTANDRDAALMIVDQIRRDVAEAAAPPPTTGGGGSGSGGGGGGGARPAAVAPRRERDRPSPATHRPVAPAGHARHRARRVRERRTCQARPGAGRPRAVRHDHGRRLPGCWLVIRRFARGADPVLYPTRGAARRPRPRVLFRLMVDRGLGVRPSRPCGSSSALARVRHHARPDPRRPPVRRTTRTRSGSRRWCCCCCRSCRASAPRSTARSCGSTLGPLTFQPAEVGKRPDRDLPRVLPHRERELLSAGRRPVRAAARRRTSGRMLLAWGASLVVLFAEKRPGRVAAVLRHLRRDALARDRPAVVPGDRHRPVRGRRVRRATCCSPTCSCASTPGCTRWTTVVRTSRASAARAGLVRVSPTGGMVGTGLGQGSPALIPYAETDFIFAAIGEELGFLGTAAVLLLYVTLIGRGLRIAVSRTDTFGKLLAAGLTTIFALQIFVIAGGRDAADPAHRRHAAARELRRLEPRRNCIMLALLVRVSAGPWLRRAADSPRPPRSEVRRWIGRSAAWGSRSSRCSRCCSPRSPTCRWWRRPDREPAGERRAPDPRRVRGRARPDPRRRPQDGVGQVASPTRTPTRPTSSCGSTRWASSSDSSPATTRRIYGRTGLEQAMNPYLAGTAPEFTTQNLTDIILGRARAAAPS